MFLHFLYAIKGLINLAVAFKTERNGNYTNCQNTKFFANACDDWSCSSSRTAAHASCNKCHFGAIAKHILDIVKTFFCSLTGFFWFVAGTEALLAELQMNRHGRII